MKLLVISIITACTIALTYADPSETGLENGQRLGWSKQDCTPVSVPDTGSTLALLGIGMASLAAWRIKLA